jgi:hypothetical protein
MPYRQHDDILSMSFYIRSSIEPQQLLGVIPPLISRTAPDLPVEALRTMPQQVNQNRDLTNAQFRSIPNTQFRSEGISHARPPLPRMTIEHWELNIGQILGCPAF